MLQRAIAIDFDGCLCDEAYPEIGAPHWDIIAKAKQEQKNGAGLILWACREGQFLQDALDACASWGLHFDAVNESLPSWIEHFGVRSRKVGANEYWDDKAKKVPAYQELPLTLDELLEMDGEPVFNQQNQEWFFVYLNEPTYGDCIINRDDLYIPLKKAIERGLFRRRPRMEE